ncbi:MAG: hypothetical protein WCB85_08620 [Candidatus Dormiibacterota bacterium]
MSSGATGRSAGVASIFPVRHLLSALVTPERPPTTVGAGLRGGDFLILAAAWPEVA